MPTATGGEPTLPPRPAGSPWPFREAAAFLGVSGRHLIRIADADRLRTIRLGRRRLIPDDEVRRLARDGCGPPSAG